MNVNSGCACEVCEYFEYEKFLDYLSESLKIEKDFLPQDFIDKMYKHKIIYEDCYLFCIIKLDLLKFKSPESKLFWPIPIGYTKNKKEAEKLFLQFIDSVGVLGCSEWLRNKFISEYEDFSKTHNPPNGTYFRLIILPSKINLATKQHIKNYLTLEKLYVNAD